MLHSVFQKSTILSSLYWVRISKNYDIPKFDSIVLILYRYYIDNFITSAALLTLLKKADYIQLVGGLIDIDNRYKFVKIKFIYLFKLIYSS